ncbi:MAG: CBS domain-containing protein [Dehalococcoidia bacterium]|nr:CBS domain-containing protein [Dehalococcoidia bacterium]
MTKKVSEVMIEKFVKVSAEDRIFQVANIVAEDCETLLACVVDKNGKLVGIITPRELLKAAEVSGYGGVRHPFFSGREALHLLSSDYARDIMSSPVSVKPDDEVQKAIDLMLYNNLYEIPVVDKDGRVVGEVNFLGIISHSVWQRDTGKE